MQLSFVKTIQFRVSTVSMSKPVLFRAIQFSISTQFSSIWPIDRSLSGAATLGQSGLGSDGIPQSSSFIIRYVWEIYIEYRL